MAKSRLWGCFVGQPETTESAEEKRHSDPRRSAIGDVARQPSQDIHEVEILQKIATCLADSPSSLQSFASVSKLWNTAARQLPGTTVTCTSLESLQRMGPRFPGSNLVLSLPITANQAREETCHAATLRDDDEQSSISSEDRFSDATGPMEPLSICCRGRRLKFLSELPNSQGNAPSCRLRYCPLESILSLSQLTALHLHGLPADSAGPFQCLLNLASKPSVSLRSLSLSSITCQHCAHSFPSPPLGTRRARVPQQSQRSNAACAAGYEDSGPGTAESQDMYWLMPLLRLCCRGLRHLRVSHCPHFSDLHLVTLSVFAGRSEGEEGLADTQISQREGLAASSSFCACARKANPSAQWQDRWLNPQVLLSERSVSLSGHFPRLSSAAITLFLGRCTGLNHLYLRFDPPKWVDQGQANLASLPVATALRVHQQSLQSIFVGNRVLPTALDALPQCPNLTSLALWDCIGYELSGPAATSLLFSALTGMPNLKKLAVGLSCALSFGEVPHVDPVWESLWTRWREEAELRGAQGLSSKLEHLLLSFNQFDDQRWTKFFSDACPRLKSFVLTSMQGKFMKKSMPVEWKDLGVLHLDSLVHCSLPSWHQSLTGGFALRVNMVHELKACASTLRYVYLGSAKIDSHTAALLGGCQRLEALCLPDSDMRDGTLRTILRGIHGSLRSLDLSNSWCLSRVDALALCTNLRVLVLRDCFLASHSLDLSLPSLANLEHLVIGPWARLLLRRLGKYGSLQVLDLGCSKRYSVSDLEGIQFCKSLRSVHFCSCPLSTPHSQFCSLLEMQGCEVRSCEACERV